MKLDDIYLVSQSPSQQNFIITLKKLRTNLKNPRLIVRNFQSVKSNIVVFFFKNQRTEYFIIIKISLVSEIQFKIIKKVQVFHYNFLKINYIITSHFLYYNTISHIFVQIMKNIYIISLKRNTKIRTFIIIIHFSRQSIKFMRYRRILSKMLYIIYNISKLLYILILISTKHHLYTKLLHPPRHLYPIIYYN